MEQRLPLQRVLLPPDGAETRRRRQIPPVMVINSSSGFGQGVVKVDGRYEGRSGSPEELDRFGPTDFAAIARDFGIDGTRIEDPADPGPALRRAIDAQRPILIDVVTDIEPRAPEAWQPPP